MKKLLISFIILLALLSNADAAWTVYTSQNAANCSNCGITEYDNALFWRIKIVSDGTALAATESESLLPLLQYVTWYLYDVTIENPASGGPAGTWNLEIRDTGIQAGTTGKAIIDSNDNAVTASTDVVIDGSALTGKYECIVKRLQILIDDTDMAITEYVTILFTFVR